MGIHVKRSMVGVTMLLPCTNAVFWGPWVVVWNTVDNGVGNFKCGRGEN